MVPQFMGEPVQIKITAEADFSQTSLERLDGYEFFARFYLSYRYFHGKLATFLLVQNIQAFTARTSYSTYTDPTCTFLLCIPLSSSNFHLASVMPCRITIFQQNETTILPSSSLWSSVIYPKYPHNTHILVFN